jgi:hypothetical protein
MAWQLQDAINEAAGHSPGPRTFRLLDRPDSSIDRTDDSNDEVKGKGKGEAKGKRLRIRVSNTDDEEEKAKGKRTAKSLFSTDEEDPKDVKLKDTATEEETDQGKGKGKAKSKRTLPQGTSIFFNVPCDNCRRKEVMCEKDVRGLACVKSKILKQRCSHGHPKRAIQVKSKAIIMDSEADGPQHLLAAEAQVGGLTFC